jgi:phage/plasmid-associated DNA primase
MVSFKDLRFCKVRKATKKPFEEDWPNKPYTWDEIQEHIQKEQNYGVLCGYQGLIIIDADSQEVRDVVDKELPKTFKVETGSKGFHYYNICKDIKKKVVLQTAERHYGEIQGPGAQCVGPGSLHPTGNTYNIINDIDIAEISKEQLFAVLKPYMKDVSEQETKALEELKDFERKYAETSDINSIPITSVLSMGGFKRANNGEWFGSNPWHGSSTGMNFWINTSKNLAHCWRCDAGLNVAKVIALEEGIIKGCNQKLSKEDFIKVLEVAQKKYGLAKPADPFVGIRSAARGRMKKVIDSFFDKADLARQIYTAQPYFYDSVKNWWLWNSIDKCWVRRDETDILNMVNENSTADTIKSKDRVEILEAMKQEGRRKVPQPVKPSWVQFKDLIVDVDEGIKIKASPDYFVTNPIPWALNPDGDGCEDTPTIDRIFREWVGESNLLLLHQILAFCLLPDYPINRLFCFIGPGMNGKSVVTGELIQMSDGTWKKAEDVNVGDEVISPQIDGTFTYAKVKNIHSRWEPNIYEVREENRKNRLLYTCAGNHDIPFYKTGAKELPSLNGKRRRKRFRILDCKEAQEIAKYSHKNSNITFFTTSAVEYKQSDSSIEPYCLGSWLGNGQLSKSCALHLSKEKEIIIKEFKKNYANEVISSTKDKRNNCYKHSITLLGSFVSKLKQLGLKSGNKFIPKECLLSSIDYRRRLLAGLIDTDGFIQKKTGAMYLTTKYPQLAEDIKELIFSLGGYCEIRDVEKGCQNGFRGKYKELSIQFVNPFIIPLLTYKKDRLKKSKDDPRIIAVTVRKKEGTGEMVYGFELDKQQSPSQWHIIKHPGTDIWMVTHNSKYLELLAKFVGKTNCTSTELDLLLDSRFEITRLHKKLVCMMGETNFAEMSKTSILKKLTGGDLIGFEYKGKDPFDDKNYAKILISTNNLPTTTDKTIGFYRRWDIVDFPNQFTEKKDVLKDIPEKEYNALANKSIKILKALLVDRKFHNEGTVEERQKKFEDRSNPFDKFWKEFVEEDGSQHIWKHEFEKKFNDWCRDNRFREFSETTIGIKMKERGIETIRREADWFTDGIKKSLRAWAGITWK